MPEFPFFRLFNLLVAYINLSAASVVRRFRQTSLKHFLETLDYMVYTTRVTFIVAIKKINIIRRVEVTDLVLSKKYVDQYRITFTTVIGLMDIRQKPLSSVRSQWFSFILIRYTLVVISYLKQYFLTMNRNSKIGTGANSEFFPCGR